LQIKDLSRLGSVLASRVAGILKPIRHKCLGLLFGNHESNYQRATEQTNLHGWLCTELGVPNLGYTAFIDVCFIRVPKRRKKPELRMDRDGISGQSVQRFRIFAHHGAGYATTPGGKLNRLIQYMYNFDADIYMIGHVHDQKGQRLVQITTNEACDKIVGRERLGIISGSYLKTYKQGVTTYGEAKGYAPVPLGASFVRIKPDTREMRAEV